MSSVFIDKKTENRPAVHTIWVGPPNLIDEPGKVPGHDIAGPIALASVNQQNPIFFWCLQDNVGHYRRKFKDTSIKVCAIEEYLQKQFIDPRLVELSKQMNVLFNTCLNQADRGSIRDKVTIKDGFSLFLLATLGGFFFDTNILPLDSIKNLEFHSYETFMMPWMNPEKKPQIFTDIDCFALFSPANNPTAITIANEFFKKWQKSEVSREEINFNKEVDLKTYQRHLGHAILDPLLKAFQEKRAGGWHVNRKIDFFIISELGIQKTFSRTHKFANRGKYDARYFPTVEHQGPDAIFFNAFSGNVQWLKQLILHGANVNDKVKISGKNTNNGFVYFKGETPLHIAIRNNHVDCVQVLLQANADVNAEVIYNDQKITALAMMKQSPNWHLFEEIINQNLSQQNKSVTDSTLKSGHDAALLAQDAAQLARDAADKARSIADRIIQNSSLDSKKFR